MQRTKIFVSSTFFDLAQVRDDIRRTITELGHEALLNEYPSFPVLPDLDTIENCRRVVRSSDLFVLIIGGRRGSVDPGRGKSITNVEYETAMENGLDCFVFIQDQVMTLLPVWRSNPQADFSPMVDSTQVFEFIENIIAAQRWIFPFARASQISETLTLQLSVFLKTLLDRRNTGRLDPVENFSHETQKARDLVLDRPRFWEYLLTEELVRSRLSRIKREYKDLERGLFLNPTKTVTAKDYLAWLPTKLGEPSAVCGVVKKAIEEELPFAWGKPGQPGNAAEILRAVDRITQACQRLLDWELEVRSVTPPAILGTLAATLQGITEVFLDETMRFPDELSKAMEGTWTGQKNVQIVLKFPSPPQLGRLETEMKKITDNPQSLFKVWDNK